MRKFEYKIMKQEGRAVDEDALNTMGEEGWEVLSITEKESSDYSTGAGSIRFYTVLFKREKGAWLS
jgi:hypothetical protein